MLAPNLPDNFSHHTPVIFSEDPFGGPLREKFDRIMKLARNLFEVPIAAVSFLDKEFKLFKSFLGQDIIETTCEESFCQYVLDIDDVFCVPEASKDSRFKQNQYVVGDPFVKFYAGYSITLNHLKVGTFYIVDNKPRHFNPEQLSWIKDMAALLETEIQKYHMTTDKGKLTSDLDKARLASMVDPLTGLWNRQGMFNILKYRMEEYLSKGSPFAIAVLDLDDFKQINDTYGHETGDNTLKAISEALMKNCRETDAISRWGGEEFLLLINESNPKYVQEIVNRVQLSIETIDAIPDMTRPPRATIGVTTIKPGSKPTIENLINLADQALYKGKRTGKNQITFI